jgi:putative ABC transport system permease protein
MKFLRRLNYMLHQGRAEADLAEEIEFHRTMSQKGAGAPSTMGNIARAREDARAVWIRPWLQSIWQDASYAVRNLRRQPGFTLVALLTLGMAIGLNTSLFTVFHLAALRPWPVKDPARLVRVMRNGHGFSLTEYRDLAATVTTLSGLAMKRDVQVHVGNEGSGEATAGTLVSGNYFRLLGVEMELGRGFLAGEDQPDAPQAVTVLSNAFWLENFGGDPQIIDKQIRMEGHAFTIVGVAARTFTLDRNLWLPQTAIGLLQPRDGASAQTAIFDPASCCADILGRLAPGVSAPSAQAELAELSGRFRDRTGQGRDTIELGPAVPSIDSKAARIMPLFGLMELAVALVLLLTCANLGNLLLARAEARRPEIYVRFALGASRARIVRQLLTESFLLSMAATGLGVALAYRLPDLVLRQFQQEARFRPAPDGTVLAYALGLAVFSCLCFGLAPALQGTKPAGRRMRLRSILLAAEVAMTVVLLVGASLLTKAVARSRSLDPGFSAADVTLVSLEFPAGAYDADAFHSRLEERLNAAADLPSFGLAEREPLSGHFNTGAKTPYGWIEVQSVSPGYFDVLRIPIVTGRNLNSGDERLRAILVNETMARRYWNGNAIGKRLKVGDGMREIVGVVKDTYSTRAGLERVDPMLYQPLPHRRTAALGKRAVPKVLVRSAPGAVEKIEAITAAIDPRVHIQAEPLAESVDRWLDPARTGAAIAGMLGVFALVLATVGMSGVFGFVVQQRTKEIGIRMALGAQPVQVVCLVLAGASRAVLVGLAAGLLAVAPISRMMQQHLSGVNPVDPAAYFPVAAALAVSALAASYLPARRATRIEPMSALRCE